GLATTFAIYGFWKKKLTVEPTAGLFVEMMVLAIPGAILLGALYDRASPDHSVGVWTLLALTGPASVLPLALFAIGAQRLRLTTLGLIQYLAPTLMFVLGLAYGEPFTPAHAVTFGLIWAGLALFSFDARRAQRSS
ncbi:MAG: EamA family transporter, partial [Pseudomonadota bacterium]